MANSFLQAVTTGEHSQCPGLNSGATAASSPAPTSPNEELFVYNYGHYYEHAPLGQVVNIVGDNGGGALDSTAHAAGGPVGKNKNTAGGGSSVQVSKSLSKCMYSGIILFSIT